MEDLRPVRHVEDGARQIRPELSQRVGCEHRGGGDAAQHQHGNRRDQPPDPAEPEAAQRDPAADVALVEQQRCDQVSADHQEHLDAEEPAADQDDIGVVEHHGQHGERPEAVERGEVRELSRHGRTCSAAPSRRGRCARGGIGDAGHGRFDTSSVVCGTAGPTFPHRHPRGSDVPRARLRAAGNLPARVGDVEQAP